MPKSSTLSVHYDPDVADLGAMILKLSRLPGKWEGRSTSEIARMGLQDWLSKELREYAARGK